MEVIFNDNKNKEATEENVKSHIEVETKEVNEDNLLKEFDKTLHSKYFSYHLNKLPEHYISLDTNRITAIYFNVIALDLLGFLDSVDKVKVIEFIYMLQINYNMESFPGSFGFIGSPYIGHSISNISMNCCFNDSFFSSQCNNDHSYVKFQQGHLAMTYTALATLITLKDDLTRVNRSSIINGF
jgi:geranylgeranyl transferase type-1 subunit beta